MPFNPKVFTMRHLTLQPKGYLENNVKIKIKKEKKPRSYNRKLFVTTSSCWKGICKQHAS